MSAFVLLALALAFVALGAVLVAVRQLVLALRRLRQVVDGTNQRLGPVLEDLQAEAAVSSAEAEALQERIEAFQAPRSRRGRREATHDPTAEADTLD